jgi:hypothetical protein
MCNRGPKWERICLCRVPTGAAVGAFNASTLDRAFVFKRAKKEYVPLTTDVLHSKQTEFQHARTLLMDEIGMCEQVLTGHTVGRARETFSAGRSFSQPQTAAPSGGLDVFCRGGDLLQLPPVLDTALYDVRAGLGLIDSVGTITETLPTFSFLTNCFAKTKTVTLLRCWGG